MTAAHSTAAIDPAEAWRSSHAPPRLDLAPLTPAEVDGWFRGGEPEADACEELLAWAARARGAIDVAIGEGLHALRLGDRLAQLGCHLDDYAREVLDLGKRAAEGLARLGRELATRPLLREAVRSGRVKLRAAQTVLGVAVGDEEAAWVERAARSTVRELEAEVHRAGMMSSDEDEAWLRLGARVRPEERAILDEALGLAGEVLPGASRMERLEALAQEFVGEYPVEPTRTTRRARFPARSGRCAPTASAARVPSRPRPRAGPRSPPWRTCPPPTCGSTKRPPRKSSTPGCGTSPICAPGGKTSSATARSRCGRAGSDSLSGGRGASSGLRSA